MSSIRYIRDGYIILGFLFVWLLSIYTSVAFSTSWHWDWINGHFATIVILIVIDSLLLFWQAVEQHKNKLYLGGSIVLTVLAGIAMISRAIAWNGVYGISFACLVVGIIVYGAAEMAVQQKG